MGARVSLEIDLFPQMANERTVEAVAMSLYDAIKTLPADKRLKYEGPHGASAVIYVEVTASGALFATLQTQARDTAGNPRMMTRGHVVRVRADCRDMEMTLRDLGVDPDNYSIV